ncbi:lipid A biosynthesis lauroyl acyltransferase [Lysobacter concretionis Ko07 = DSM 16239]|uniref:Lipid A biosynthesis acyltransferase n=1 Tax=Lysobacter concretionis Ko07 = DSM 16239 TaxID=1122185 RepID=A0A0A0EP01_9GAMM|nr:MULTISPECIES: LpxL/LpxP family Kdo(2)-lipid IV(A) lauroyl/palmitoleoyl acyltransferase [Lysobacter]KGM50897.1 lipid A biosynthesis lauroyl acyltransferase [Lysobacter concretionis Ko07 = DSM 16239]QOD90720.1 LpxL/LpxP family Kdo(2)-lipid IV(A) lauroyl/palmitoleoyl acyltransferase [Lysobacter sp. CW239]
MSDTASPASDSVPASPTSAGAAPLGPRHWPMWLALGGMWLAARLPWSLQRVLGAGIGALALRLAGERRQAARINLSLCFPELDEASREALLRASFRDLGIGLFEFARAWWGSVAPMRRTTRIEGVEAIEAIRAQGRGVLLVSGHFLTLEICGRLMCDHLPLAGMYRRHRSPVMEWAVKRGRLRYASAMFANAELRPAMRHLKQGGLLWYAPDQDMRGKDTVFAPFFGVPAATITATHQFARLTGCAVVPFFHRREGADYVLRLGAPLGDFPSSDAAIDSTKVNAAIEAMVREAPSQYLWIHRRFKRRPPGMSSPYRRG